MRRFPLLMLVGLALCAAPPADAALRSPQVPVSGTALATFFASESQAINPATDQQELQQLSVAPGTNFEMRERGPDVTVERGALQHAARHAAALSDLSGCGNQRLVRGMLVSGLTLCGWW